jgi:DNA-binding NarL/FixJ family response regulator
MPLRLVLADDHHLVRERCRALLQREGFEIAGEAADGREALRLALAHHPDVAILDWSMPLLDGLDAARDIVEHCPRTRVVILTTHREDYQIAAAFRAGICAYVVKTHVADELVTAIREVAAGRIFLSACLCGDIAG